VALTRAEAVARLVVALDTADRAQAVDLARRLHHVAGVMKVGLEAFTTFGPGFVGELIDGGARVFLDLKLHDIPNTVERAAASCARLGVSMLNVHAAGGPAMLRAALAGAEAGTPAGKRRPEVLAVTVLTSLEDATLALLGVQGSAQEVVVRWARLSQEAGCDGVVCSAREAAVLRATLGEEFILLTPGIRPAGGEVGDQRRVVTPAQAIAAGATYLVVGRPITAASDPVGAAEGILAEMCSASPAGSPGGGP